MIVTKLTHKLQLILFASNFAQAPSDSEVESVPDVLSARKKCDDRIRRAFAAFKQEYLEAKEELAMHDNAQAFGIPEDLPVLDDANTNVFLWEPRWVFPNFPPRYSTQLETPPLQSISPRDQLVSGLSTPSSASMATLTPQR